MVEEIKEFENCIPNYLQILRSYVTPNDGNSRDGYFHSRLNQQDIENIICHIKEVDVNVNMKGLEMYTGFTFKEEKHVVESTKIFDNKLKLHDFVIFIDNILISTAVYKLYESKSPSIEDVVVEGNVVVSSIKRENNQYKATLSSGNSTDEIYVNQKDLHDAVLSIVTHEFMHSISVGFADDTTRNDEVYTNLYAEELFKKVLPKGKFYDMYMVSLNKAKYIEEMKAAKEEREEKDKIRNLYFKGVDK